MHHLQLTGGCRRYFFFYLSESKKSLGSQDKFRVGRLTPTTTVLVMVCVCVCGGACSIRIYDICYLFDEEVIADDRYESKVCEAEDGVHDPE